MTQGWSEGKSGRLPKIDPNFSVSFPANACSPTFHKNEQWSKKDAINEFGIKYWTSNAVWVTFQEYGSSLRLVWWALMLLVNQIRIEIDVNTDCFNSISSGYFHWHMDNMYTLITIACYTSRDKVLLSLHISYYCRSFLHLICIHACIFEISNIELIIIKSKLCS